MTNRSRRKNNELALLTPNCNPKFWMAHLTATEVCIHPGSSVIYPHLFQLTAELARVSYKVHTPAARQAERVVSWLHSVYESESYVKKGRGPFPEFLKGCIQFHHRVTAATSRPEPSPSSCLQNCLESCLSTLHPQADLQPNCIPCLAGQGHLTHSIKSPLCTYKLASQSTLRYRIPEQFVNHLQEK